MYQHSSWLGRLLRALLARRTATVVQMSGARGRADLALLRETRGLAPLLVQDAAAFQLLAAVRAGAGLGGAMAEAGVFAGGTARLICEAKGALPLHLFDVFEGLQPGAPDAPAGRDAAAVVRHFGSVHAPQAAVRRLLAGYPGVHFHPGVFPATARGLEDLRFGFVHLDLDLEGSTRDALGFFHPRLLPGALLIVDDYDDPGVRRAADGYLEGRGDTALALPWGQLLVVRGR
jgi:hypothetical protein